MKGVIRVKQIDRGQVHLIIETNPLTIMKYEPLNKFPLVQAKARKGGIDKLNVYS